MAVVSMNYLLEAGVHFGHQTKRWDPKMKEYIYTSRDDIYIIDLQKTAKKIEEAYNALNKIASEGGKVLFVGTRKQASEAIKDEATRSKSYYVTQRWLGGTLTNFKTIRRRIKRLEEIEKMEKDGTFELLPKKEVGLLKKEYDKLNSLLCGIREMHQLPQALYIVDPSKEIIAIREARKLKIPIFGIVDTNCNPDMVDYVIPANDDAIRAVKLITSVMANAIIEATGGEIIDYVSDKVKDENATEVMQKALETVKRKEDNQRRENRFDRKNFNKRDTNRRTFTHAREPRVYKQTPVVTDVKKEIPVKEEPVTKEVRQETTVKEATVTKEVKKETPVKEATVTKEVKKAEDLSVKTVSDLRELAKSKNIKGYSTMKKAELLEALK